MLLIEADHIGCGISSGLGGYYWNWGNHLTKNYGLSREDNRLYLDFVDKYIRIPAIS